MHAFGIAAAKDRLVAAGGGYEIVHESPGLELGVDVLVATEPDRQQPHEDDEVYIVLVGNGMLQGESLAVAEGSAAFEAGANTASAPTSSRAYWSSSIGALRKTRSFFRV